jgi:hypothetical protein
VTLTLVVPEIIVVKRWQRILHNRIAARLRAALIAYDGIIITTVPFDLPDERVTRAVHRVGSSHRSSRRGLRRPGQHDLRDFAMPSAKGRYTSRSRANTSGPQPRPDAARTFTNALPFWSGHDGDGSWTDTPGCWNARGAAYAVGR